MVLISTACYEKKAKEILPKSAADYYASGADEETTLKLTKNAFQKIKIRPRFLRDPTNGSMRCRILGNTHEMPIGISPTAMQKMAHVDGEVATARAAGKFGTIFILSTLSTTSLEEVAKGAPDTIKWYQLYIYKDRELTKQMIRRAESSGYKAIVLTVDAPVFGVRRADILNKFQLPEHLGLGNFLDARRTIESKGGSGINEYVAKQFDPTIQWKDVEWLVSFTKLPVILKGILTKEDALLAAASGCKGVIVSNHGARQLDTVQATIEALPEIVQAVGGQLTVMLDGGIAQGTDAFKAIALGADFVFFGRPALWGLAVGGQEGVENVLNIFKTEFNRVMLLAGTPTLKDITQDFVIREQCCSKL